MPAHKKRSPSKPTTRSRSSSAPRRPSKVKALAISDAVRREPHSSRQLVSPLAILEPLRRRLVEQQIELLGAALTWSPAHIIISQQAAFWDGFVTGAAKPPLRGKPRRKHAKGQ